MCRNYAGVAVGKEEFIPSLTRLLTRQVCPVTVFFVVVSFLVLFSLGVLVCVRARVPLTRVLLSLWFAKRRYIFTEHD